MTDTRREQELRREGARQAMKECFAPFAGFPNQTIADMVDRLFPLPTEEPDTVEAFGLIYRMRGKELEARDAGFLNSDNLWEVQADRDDYLAVADLIHRHRDRAWVAEHPDGVEDPHAPECRWRIRDGQPETRWNGYEWLDATWPWTSERAALVVRLKNGQPRRAP